jgi:hypothetical protein
VNGEPPMMQNKISPLEKYLQISPLDQEAEIDRYNIMLKATFSKSEIRLLRKLKK